MVRCFVSHLFMNLCRPGECKNSYMQLTWIFLQQHEIEVTSLCSDPLLGARHPLHFVFLLQNKMKLCSVKIVTYATLFHKYNRIMYLTRIQVCDLSFFDFCSNFYKICVYILSNIQRSYFWLIYL